MGEPLTLMRCERLGATMTTRGCAAMWRSAAETRPNPWDAKAKCRGCPIGAINAGVAVAQAQDTAALDEARQCCPRCTRLAPRLIKGSLCISCYNAHLDVLRGHNRRGNRPGLADKLHPVTLWVRGATLTQLRFDLVLGTAEAMARAAMQTPGPFIVTPPPFAPLPGWQQVLPLLNAPPARHRQRIRRRGPSSIILPPAPPPPAPTLPFMEWAA